MIRWTRRILLLVILIVGVGYLVYVKQFRPMSVSGHEVSPGTLVIEVMGTGTLEARTSTTISSKIQGRLESLFVDEGDRVDAGAIIAVLDDNDLVSQVEVAQATLEASLAGLDRLKAEQTRTQAVLRLARREDERIRRVFDRGAATETELDQSVEAVAVAQADLARATAAIAEGQKLVIAATKNLEYQQIRLADTVIKAPFEGLIVRRDRDPGDIVVPGSSIYRLVATDELWVSAWVDETSMASLAPEQPARVVLRSEPDQPYAGRVVRLGRETDRETREFVVDVAMDRQPRHWAVGQRAEVFIETRRLDDVLVIPLAYVFGVDGRKGVYLHRGGRAVWTVCDFGMRGRTQIEVRGGLEDGDVILLSSDLKTRSGLRDGMRVVIE